MKIRDRKVHFQKLDNKVLKFHRGRPCIKLPGRIIITPTNFASISYLNLDEYSYNHYYGHIEIHHVPRIIAEEYFEYKYLKNRDSGLCRDFNDLESKHLSEAKSFMIYEYDLHIARRLISSWDPQVFRRYLEYYSRSSKKFNFQRSSFVYSTFTNILLRNSTDSKLIVDFFKTICTHIIACEGIFLGPMGHLEKFLLHSQRTGFDPWILMRMFQAQKDSPIMEFCPVEWALIQGKLELLKLLLSYGCSFNVSNYSAKLFNRKIDGRWWNRSRTIPIVMPREAEISTKKVTLEDDIAFRNSATFYAHLTVVLYLTLDNAVHFAGDYIDCIKLFMRSVPYPNVSSEDMQEIVAHLAPSIEDMIEKSCEWYKKKLPSESKPGRKPRSLMHLSRCVVRRHCKLPDGTEQLNFPNHLKSYLNLEW